MANVTCSIDNDDCGGRGYLRRGWCSTHYSRWKRWGDPLFSLTIYRDDERRFWSKVDKRGSIPESKPELGSCWVWTAFTDKGYGRFNVGRNGFVLAHRWSYERERGPVPDGLEVDHCCHDPEVCEPGVDCPHRRCVNPAHLEAVPRRINVLRSGGVGGVNARKDRCDKGHLFSESNTRINGSGSRVCLECERDGHAARLAAETDEARAGRNAVRQAVRIAAKLAEGRSCNLCGVDISLRSRRAIYCEQCAVRKPTAGRACPLCDADISHRPAHATFCERCASDMSITTRERKKQFRAAA